MSHDSACSSRGADANTRCFVQPRNLAVLDLRSVCPVSTFRYLPLSVAAWPLRLLEPAAPWPSSIPARVALLHCARCLQDDLNPCQTRDLTNSFHTIINQRHEYGYRWCRCSVVEAHRGTETLFRLMFLLPPTLLLRIQSKIRGKLPSPPTSPLTPRLWAPRRGGNPVRTRTTSTHLSCHGFLNRYWR